MTLKHLLKFIKQTVKGIYMNTFSFYLENNTYIKVLLHDFTKIISSSSKIYLTTL